jgi:hypothetical protein
MNVSTLIGHGWEFRYIEVRGAAKIFIAGNDLSADGREIDVYVDATGGGIWRNDDRPCDLVERLRKASVSTTTSLPQFVPYSGNSSVRRLALLCSS